MISYEFKKPPLLICLIFIFAFLTLNCKEGKASTGWWIFRRPQSTKPKAITTVAAVRGNLPGVFYNPCILGTITEREIFFLTELGLAQDSFGGLIYGQPIGSEAGISTGFVYYDAGKMTLYWIENNNEQSREVSAQRDILGFVSYAHKIGKMAVIGANVKFANSKIAEEKDASAVACDLGLMLFTSESLSLSFAAQNLGVSTKFVSRAEELPASIWFGSAYNKKISANSYLVVGFELPYIMKESKIIPSIAIEYGTGLIEFNVGYWFGSEEPVIHTGFGITISNFDFGYAFIPAKYLSHAHRLNLGCRF